MVFRVWARTSGTTQPQEPDPAASFAKPASEASFWFSRIIRALQEFVTRPLSDQHVPSRSRALVIYHAAFSPAGMATDAEAG
jgi:hypothetical protein